MKITKYSPVRRYSLLVLSLLGMAGIWGLVIAQKAGVVPGALEIFIFVLILIGAIYSFVVEMKKHKDARSGLPAEDEFSEQIKFRAGYYSFMTSIYIWLSLFLLKDLFADYDTLFGLGLMLPLVIFMALRSYLTRGTYEDSH